MLTPFPIVVDRVPAHEQKLVVSVEWERRTSKSDHRWMKLDSRSFTVPIEIAEAAVPLAGVDTPTLAQSLQEVFEGVVAWESGVRPRRIQFNFDCTRREEFDGIAIGVEVDVLHDGKLARRSRLWWPAGWKVNPLPNGRMPASWEPAEEYPEVLSQFAKQEGRWTMRVRGCTRWRFVWMIRL